MRKEVHGWIWSNRICGRGLRRCYRTFYNKHIPGFESRSRHWNKDYQVRSGSRNFSLGIRQRCSFLLRFLYVLMQPDTMCYSEIYLCILAVSSVASVDVLACNRMSDAFDGNLMLTAQILAHYLCCKKNGLPKLSSLNFSEKIIKKWWFPK